jgi:hypothetical protein
MAEEMESSKDEKKTAVAWRAELAIAEKELRKFWERGRKVIKRFLDDTDGSSLNAASADRFNLFWANTGVLKASLYANPPKPLVKREYDDYMDDEARVAAIMMQRLLTQGFEKPDSDVNTAFRQTTEDRLLPGLGQVWLRYVPDIEESELEPEVTDKKTKKVIKEALTVSTIKNEAVATDYVYWSDFLWSPARIWTEVRWVARRVWLTKREFRKRFSEKHINLVSWTKKEPAKNTGERVTPETMGIDKTEVFEIWHRPTKTVHWISKSCDYELDSSGDPLELEGFFPCPRPLLGTHTTSSLIPKADYLMVQSQYRRLDNLTVRIGLLEDAIQASGVYDKANKELGQLLPGNGTNKMIAVDNWAMFAEKGGMKGVVDWFPLEMIVSALDKLRELKTEAKNELYELTGISDIMRGTTAPRETLGAQELKSQYSSVRLQYVQGEVAEFIQGALRIKADIISKHFQLETIVRNSNIELTPDADLAVQAAQLLKDEWAACYRVQVFADTLAIPDYNAERAGRTEFITAAGQFISQVMPLIEMEPGAGPFLMQMLQWGVASFRSAQTIEGIFDKAIAQMKESLKQPKPPAPDPKMIKAQAEAQAVGQESSAKVQAINQKTAAELQRKQQEMAESAQRTDSELRKDNIQTMAEISAVQVQAEVAVTTGHAKTQEQIRASRAKTAAQIAAITAKSRAAVKATGGSKK